MFKKKGFTLIEVIVSIALIGIIAVMFLPGLANYFKWIIDTKTNITKSAFESQLEVERNTNIIKEAIIGLGIGEEINTSDFLSMGMLVEDIGEIKLFEDQYPKETFRFRKYPKAYLIKSKLNESRSFVSLVGDKRLPELAVPEIKAEALFFLKEGFEAMGSFEYANYPDLQIKAVSNMFSNPENSFNRYRHDWYVSKPGFIIPVLDIASIDEDFDMGRIYPSFPDDYEAVPISSEIGINYSYKNTNERIITGKLSNSKIREDDKYIGRHFGYTITPFAKSLKTGNVSTILPLYVYGPKNTSDLVAHLDASVINIGDLTGVIEKDGGFLHLKSWENTRPSLESPNETNNAVQSDRDNMPIIKTSELAGNMTPEIPFQGEGETASVWGRSLGNKGNQMANMKISDITLNKNFNIYMIMRRVDNPESLTLDETILSGNKASGDETWALNWINDVDNPNLSFNVNGLDSRDPIDPVDFIEELEPVTLQEAINLNEWYLIEISRNASEIKVKANNLTIGNNSSFQAGGEFELFDNSNSSIDINWNGVEIAELLIYNRDITSTEVTTYLINKYKALE